MIYPTRKVLVTQNSQSVVTTTGLAADYGTVDVARYSRFSGLYTTVGSIGVRFRSGVASGNLQVSSTFAANSGSGVIDMLNFGRYAAFDITGAHSTAFSLLIFGEPRR